MRVSEPEHGYYDNDILNYSPSFAVAVSLAVSPMIDKSHRTNLYYGEEKNPVDLLVNYFKKNPFAA